VSVFPLAPGDTLGSDQLFQTWNSEI
jgi:hypothetical protein